MSACRRSTVGSSLLFTVLPSTTTLGGVGRTGGGVLGRRSGFAGDGMRFSVPWNDLGRFAWCCTDHRIFANILTHSNEILVCSWTMAELGLVWCHKPFASQVISLSGAFLVIHLVLSGRWHSGCTENNHTQLKWQESFLSTYLHYASLLTGSQVHTIKVRKIPPS